MCVYSMDREQLAQEIMFLTNQELKGGNEDEIKNI